MQGVAVTIEEMEDFWFRVIDLCLKLATLIVAAVGAWKIYGEIKVSSRKRPILYPLVGSALGEASLSIVNASGKPVIIIENTHRYTRLGGEEGRTPYFTALERQEAMPVKIEDGESYKILGSINADEVVEVSVDCIFSNSIYQWTATVHGMQAIRNTYAELESEKLTKIKDTITK